MKKELIVRYSLLSANDVITFLLKVPVEIAGCHSQYSRRKKKCLGISPPKNYNYFKNVVADDSRMSKLVRCDTTEAKIPGATKRKA